MFAQLNPTTARRERWLRGGAIAFHGLLLAWLLHAPDPMLLQLNAVAAGHNGTSLTRLYFPSKSVDNSKHSSADSATQRYKHERMGQNKLTWARPVELAKNTPKNEPTHTKVADDSKTQTLSALGHGAPAGTPYGGAIQGAPFGDEIRPALPSATSDPVVYPWQLPSIPGNEVIEITIDEHGNIVRKTVLVSLGPDIDTKCLAALENWRFHPATRNGAPIPSKQDAIFPFKARG
jgi:outer membrane biosynthesis protein TonB